MKLLRETIRRIIKEERAKILEEQPQQLDLDYILDLVAEALAEGGAIASARDRDAAQTLRDRARRAAGQR